MTRELIPFLQCPTCRQGTMQETTQEPRQLVCSHYHTAYPVVNGVPRFVPHEHYAGSFG